MMGLPTKEFKCLRLLVANAGEIHPPKTGNRNSSDDMSAKLERQYGDLISFIILRRK